MTHTELKAWRARMGWTQKKAAQELGFDQRTLRNYEQGKNQIPHAVALACQWLEQEEAKHIVAGRLRTLEKEIMRWKALVG